MMLSRFNLPRSDDRAMCTETKQAMATESEEEWTLVTHKQSAKRVSNQLISAVEGAGSPNPIGVP